VSAGRLDGIWPKVRSNNGFQKHIYALQYALIFGSYLFSAPLVGQTGRARLFRFSTISPSSRSDLTCRDGPSPSTDRPRSSSLLAKTIRGCRNTRSSRMIPFANRDGGGFRVDCQPLITPNRPLIRSPFPVTRQGQFVKLSSCRQHGASLRAAWIPVRCPGATSPCAPAETPEKIYRSLERKEPAALLKSRELSAGSGRLKPSFYKQISVEKPPRTGTNGG
jgi:hypothetical protein